MGVSFGAFAGIGVILDPDEFEEKGQRAIEPSCLHPARTGNAFCPACGVRVENRVIMIPKFDFGDIVEFLDLCPDNREDLDFRCLDGRRFFLGWGENANHNTYITTVRVSEIPDEGVVWRDIEKALDQWPDLLRQLKFGFHIVKTVT